MRRLEIAEMEERRTERPVADHLQIRIADAVEELEHLEGDVARRRDLSGHDVMRREAHEHGDDARRILHLSAEHPCAGVRRANLRHRVSAAGLERHRVTDLQLQLGRGLRRAVRFGEQQVQAAPCKAGGFVVGVEPRGRLRRQVPEMRRLDVVPRGFEQDRE